jgi:hypothetical protein
MSVIWPEQHKKKHPLTTMLGHEVVALAQQAWEISLLAQQNVDQGP